MKVRLILTVDVDPDAWTLTYGTARGEIRDDVRAYVLGQVVDSAAAHEGAIRAASVRVGDTRPADAAPGG